MPKKSSVSKTPIKTLDLDKKIDAIKGEIDKIIDEEEQQIEEVIKPEPVIIQTQAPVKKQPKIIEEIIEEDDPEPIIIRKIIKKKPKQIIEEVEEEEEPEPVKPKKKDGRGRPIGSIKKLPKEQEEPHKQKSYNNRERFDTMLDESNIELLRQEMKKEMKRRLMSSLFD